MATAEQKQVWAFEGFGPEDEFSGRALGMAFPGTTIVEQGTLPAGRVLQTLNNDRVVVSNGFGGTTTRAVQPATDRQISYLRKLVAERKPDTAPEFTASVIAQGKSRVSKAIERLLSMPVVTTEATRVPTARTTPVREPVTEDGYYAVGEQVYKVQDGENGLYARKLIPGVGLDKAGKPMPGRWEYQRGLIYRLSAANKLDFEQAKQFGALYGYCCACGRTLHKDESIAAGIGPVCAGKFS